MRVLIVDDSPLFRQALQEWLQEWGAFDAVTTAGDGTTALHLARLERPDLILMDLQMPGWSGLETTRRIKAEMPDIRILVMTAAEAESLRAAAIRHGAEDCIEKDATQLQRALKRFAPPTIHELRFRAMNCEMGAWVVTTDARAARRRLRAARRLVETVEARLSRFCPESELSRLNAQAGQAVRVSSLLWETLRYALDAAQRTGGIYDPTVLDALEAAGYDRSFDSPRGGPVAGGSPNAKPAIRKGPLSWRDVRLDPRTRRVTLPVGLRLDLGGIAKGWAAERAADRLAPLGACLVDAGGDIAARGSPPGEPGWPVAVADPRDPDADLMVLLVRDRGVATSGIDYRRWVHNGAFQHHLIDPRTRRPAQTDLLTATVVAPDAAQADLHAMVAMILGLEEGLRYLARQRGVEGLLIRQDGEVFATAGFWRYVAEPLADHRAVASA